MDEFSTLFRTRGAVAAVASALGITQAAVSQWRNLGGIPDKRIADVRSALEAHLRSVERPKRTEKRTHAAAGA